MKKSFSILALVAITLVFLFTGATIAAGPAAPSLTFEGTKYYLAWKDVSAEGNLTNEYLKKGETLEEWTTLIGVRHWPAAEELSDVVAPYVESMRPYYVSNAEIYTSQEAKDDIVIEMFLGAPGRPYVEYNLHRFVIEKGTPGVKAYQFAQRIPLTEDLDLSETQKFLETRLNQLKAFKVTLHR
ncbi:hypothetical protein [Geobacter sp.]|uniref:hypothetical protein n=1 Tax=Geobacter sp. TaxID=46610 RepID=UPI001AD2FA2F|nr:hypothetical protein [Geobacter sp.]CAG0946904.1 hypothetical protein ANRL1_03421 [Anaerolineae bacterium]